METLTDVVQLDLVPLVPETARAAGRSAPRPKVRKGCAARRNRDRAWEPVPQKIDAVRLNGRKHLVSYWAIAHR
jgi:hypothetical protein